MLGTPNAFIGIKLHLYVWTFKLVDIFCLVFQDRSVPLFSHDERRERSDPEKPIRKYLQV